MGSGRKIGMTGRIAGRKKDASVMTSANASRKSAAKVTTTTIMLRKAPKGRVVIKPEWPPTPGSELLPAMERYGRAGREVRLLKREFQVAISSGQRRKIA